MSHEAPKLAATPREKTGSTYARRLRKQGRLPGVIYGHKLDPVAVSVDEKEILTHLRHGTHVLTLAVQGAKPETCLVKELQFGYLGDNVIHVDFTRVDLEEEVEVAVHLKFVGEPKAAEQAGAILSYDVTSLDVRCRVDAIPDEIKVDLNRMGEETVLTVADITLPPGVTAVDEPDTPVAHVAYVKKEEEAVVGEEAEVEGAAAEPEVITEAKPDADEEGESSS